MSPLCAGASLLPLTDLVQGQFLEGVNEALVVFCFSTNQVDRDSRHFLKKSLVRFAPSPSLSLTLAQYAPTYPAGTDLGFTQQLSTLRQLSLEGALLPLTDSPRLGSHILAESQMGFSFKCEACFCTGSGFRTSDEQV